MAKKSVSIVMGSDSDFSVMKQAVDILKQFKVPYEVRVLSAHRSPEALVKYVQDSTADVFIAAAGGAAHLAGAVAANTTCPVLGVPINSALNGLDSLLSTVQMPKGIPVGTLAIGDAGAVNAAILAVQILALSDSDLAKALKKYKESLAEKVVRGNEKVARIC
jgi:5-(carboxyamino)imidazole ribonucleotide mutase